MLASSYSPMVRRLSSRKHVESKLTCRFIKIPKLFLFTFVCLWIRILISAEDLDSRKWACDGLAYLTLDADIKEILADDTTALKALFELAKVSRQFYLIKIQLKK